MKNNITELDEKKKELGRKYKYYDKKGDRCFNKKINIVKRIDLINKKLEKIDIKRMLKKLVLVKFYTSKDDKRHFFCPIKKLLDKNMILGVWIDFYNDDSGYTICYRTMLMCYFKEMIQCESPLKRLRKINDFMFNLIKKEQ